MSLAKYLRLQWDWSAKTFGPGKRTKGIVQHIRKELAEIEARPDELSEWVDVMILAMDGFWRHGGQPEDLMVLLETKQCKNFARTWPDWREVGEDSAIEHDRSKDQDEGFFIVPKSAPSARYLNPDGSEFNSLSSGGGCDRRCGVPLDYSCPRCGQGPCERVSR